jgi:L-malate glycosyltransferase
VNRRLRIFVPSAAELLTDHAPNGEGLIAWQLFSGLAGRGHEVVVCARRADLNEQCPFQLIETGPASRFESIEPLMYARRVRAIFEGLGGPSNFDAVHWLFPQGQVNSFVPPPGTSYVVGPLSPSWPQDATSGRRRAGDAVRAGLTPLFERLHRRTLEAASCILISTAAALKVVPPVVHQKTRVLPYGVDSRRFAPTPLPQHPVVLFLGRLEAPKGVRYLVEAFASVRTEVPDAVLVLAGDGPERPWVEQRRRELDLDDSIQLRGHVPHEQTPQLLRECSLLCLPSHGEPFGMVLLEAMAAGRPVVAVGAGGPRCLVDPERGGRLVNWADHLGLSVVLAELLKDKAKLINMGRFNRAQVDLRFNLDYVIGELESIYQGVKWADN